MGGAGVGHTCHIVNVLGNAVFPVCLCHDAAVAIAGYLHVLALIASGGVAVVGPQEGADFHFLVGRCQLGNAIRGDFHNLAGAKLPHHLVAQLLAGVILEGDGIAVFVLFNHNGQPSHFVPGGNQVSALLHNQDGSSTLNPVLGVADALGKILFLVNHGGNQLVGVDPSAGHAVEMPAGAVQMVGNQRLGIVNHADGANGVDAQPGANEDGLGVGVGDAADGGGTGHFIENALKFGTEGGVLNVVNFPLHPHVLVPGSHAAPPGSQVGMVVGSEKNIQDAVAAGCRAKETTHMKSSLFTQLRLQRGILFQYLCGIGDSLGIQLGGQRFIADGQNLGCKQSGIHASVDGNSGDRNTGGHLDC